MRKLIFFDIDGTVVTENGEERIIPDSAIKAIRKLQENGHLCFINSGRTMSEVDETIHALKMDGFVCGCGTHISYHDEDLFFQTIPPALGTKVIRDLDDCGLEWLLEGKNTLYYSTRPYHTHIGDFQKEHMESFGLECSLVSPEEAHDLAFDKFCVCTTPESDLTRFQKKYAEHFWFIDRGEGFYEVIPNGCSKASGIQFLMDYFQIDLKDTYAIGDSTNDLPMLEFAGTSIAMGNSSPAILPYVDYVTKSVLEDGIYLAMEHYGLI